MDPEVGEFGRLFQRFLERMSHAAQEEQTSPLRDLLDAHLGEDCSALPVVSESFMPYDHVNVQVAVDAYLAGEGRRSELHGATGQQRHYGSFSDLIQQSRWNVVGLGSVDFENLPIGPDDTLACVKFGIYLIDDRGTKLALLMRGSDEQSGQGMGMLEVLGTDREAARALLDEVRRLMIELNVFRGQVLAFGESQMGHVMLGPIVFLRRPELGRDQLILPDDVLESVEREVFGVAEQRERLRASGQHVKRGILLWGPPGTGKTHTVRYLISRLREHTVFVLTGGGLHMVRPACALARMLQPSVVVLEDIDLVAQHREAYGMNGNPLLFDVLNEIDGIAEDADVTFVLTTNRADLLEPALAARPGRVDLAVEVVLPDSEARRRLIELYGRGLSLRLDDVDAVIDRTDGVTASFVKELMRKAALVSAMSSNGAETIEVTDAHVAEALDELLSERHALTRALLGGSQPDDD
jgi:cell division protease FtsH